MPCPHRSISGITTRHEKLLGCEIPWVETLIFIHISHAVFPWYLCKMEISKNKARTNHAIV